MVFSFAFQDTGVLDTRTVNISTRALKKHHYSQKYFLRCNNIYGNAVQRLTVVEGMYIGETPVTSRGHVKTREEFV